MRLAPLLSFVFVSAMVIGTGYSASFAPPQWAFGAGEKGKPYADDGHPKRLAGSSRAYTFTQIEDSFAPADWYPNDHPPMPQVPVATGRKPDVRACSWCHLPNGLGHPQSSALAGLSADYMARQLADFKSGARHSSVGNSIMATISRAMTADEAQAAVTYFSKLRRRPWIKVVENAMVPKTEIVEGGLRIQREPEQQEPLGERIVEVPEYRERTRLYDSHAGFVAYVPVGSIKRGKDFAAAGAATVVAGKIATPGKTVACSECHGKDLRGAAHAPDSTLPVPGLTGRSPIYIVRQLYDFHSGARSGAGAELMKPIATQMTLRDMIDVAAYLGSLAP
jgi:cytochrome c553